MSSAGLMKGRPSADTRQPLGMQNPNIAPKLNSNNGLMKQNRTSSGGGGVRVQIDGSRELVISLEDITSSLSQPTSGRY